MGKSRVTAILNQKGGVGKTTTCSTLITGLSLLDMHVIGIDADAQGNLTDTMGGNAENPGVFEAMDEQGIYVQKLETGDLLCANINLYEAEERFTGRTRYYKLRKVVNDLRREYDHIIIDCPPNLGVMSYNALAAADDVVIPIQPARFAIQGLVQLCNTIENVRELDNPNLKIAGLLITMLDVRKGIHNQYEEALRNLAEQRNIPIYTAIITNSTKVEEAQAQKKNILLYDRKGKATQCYVEFFGEYVKQERGV